MPPRSDRPANVYLPRAVLEAPPLGGAGLSVFDFIIAAAVLVRARHDDNNTILTSHRALLVDAQLAVYGGSKGRVGIAVTRLLQPVGEFPPVLLSATRRSPYKHELVVHPWWRTNAYRVSLPLPSDGRLVLALHLFVHGINLDPDTPGRSTLASLQRRFRLSSRPSHALRELRRALTLLNEFRQNVHAAPPLTLKEIDDGRLQIATTAPAPKTRDRGTPFARQYRYGNRRP